MPAARVIARLDVKGPNLVKGIHLEGLRVMGDPQQFAQRYYAEGADEILYVDIVASLYGRTISWRSSGAPRPRSSCP